MFELIDALTTSKTLKKVIAYWRSLQLRAKFRDYSFRFVNVCQRDRDIWCHISVVFLFDFLNFRLLLFWHFV